MPALRALLCAALALSSISPQWQHCSDYGLDTLAAAQTQTQDQSLHDKKHWSWDNCGTEDAPVHVTDVRFSTDAPTPGDELTVTVTGRTAVDIADGAFARVLLMMGSFEYIKKDYPLCGDSSAAASSPFNVTCPLKAGNQELVNSITIPDTMPVASYYMRYHLYSAKSDDLGCVEFHIDLIEP